MNTTDYVPKVQDPAHLRIGTLLTTLVSQIVKLPADNKHVVEILIHPDGEYHVSEGQGYNFFEVQPEADKWIEQLKQVLTYTESQADYDIACSMPGNFVFKTACDIKIVVADIRKALCF